MCNWYEYIRKKSTQTHHLFDLRLDNSCYILSVDCPLFNFLLITLYSCSDSHTSSSALISVQRETERMKEWKEEVQRRGGGKNKLHSPPNREPSLIMLFESSQKPSLLNRPVLAEPWIGGFLAVPSRARLPYFLSLIIFCLPLIIRGPPCP